MTEPALALQSAVRAVLVAASPLTALVPASSIMDANQRPGVMPALLLGEGQTIPGEGLARINHDCYLTIHVWAQEAGTVYIKQVVGAIRDALFDVKWDVAGLIVADLYIQSAHFMRDPDTVHSHAVVTLNARVMELV